MRDETLWRALAASGLGALAWTSAARAQAPCPIRVVPGEAPGWQAAARAVEERTREATPRPHDCQSTQVTVQADGSASLEFTTTEGGHAIRRLQAPDELGPAIEALLVTVAPAPTVPAVQIEPSKPAPRFADTSAEPPAPREKPHFVLGAGAGTRLTFGHKYLAPAVSLRATGVFDRWELGVSGEWDPVFTRLVGSTPAGFAMSALVVGALFGRRERVRRFDVGYGFSLAIASVASSANAGPNHPINRSVDASQQRVGFYAGARFPRKASTRVTLDVAADAALSGLRGVATSEANLPGFPRYGTSLSLGVETVAL